MTFYTVFLNLDKYHSTLHDGKIAEIFQGIRSSSEIDTSQLIIYFLRLKRVKTRLCVENLMKIIILRARNSFNTDKLVTSERIDVCL